MNKVRWPEVPTPGDIDGGGRNRPPGAHGGPGGGGSDRPPRREVRRWLPWLGLGVALLGVERLALLTLAMAGLSGTAYAVAAIVFVVLVLGGVAVGGRAFHRAWHAARREEAQARRAARGD